MEQDSDQAKGALLKALATKYIWWKSPEDAIRNERRVVAQIMDIGDFEDVRIALNTFGKEPFEDALRHADPGWFSAKSWAYWHYRSGITPYQEAPPVMPSREFSR